MASSVGHLYIAVSVAEELGGGGHLYFTVPGEQEIQRLIVAVSWKEIIKGVCILQCPGKRGLMGYLHIVVFVEEGIKEVCILQFPGRSGFREPGGLHENLFRK